MKNILKTILFSIVMLSAVSAKAHQADISSFTLVEEQPGHWMLQLNASMTAFQYEVRNAYGIDSYASPEEFNQLLLTHLKSNISIEVNGKNIMLENGLVQLGHATTVAFELTGVPKTLETVFVKNKGFENINRSQAIFTIVKEGVDKSSFLLSEANEYQLKVSVVDNQVLLADTSWIENWPALLAVAVLSTLGGLVFYKVSSKKTTLSHKSLISA